MLRPIIGIIGLGKVGETLARLLCAQGFDIGAVYNRTHDKAYHLASEVESIALHDAGDIVTHTDLTIIAVSDDAIESIAQELTNHVTVDKAIIHVSGTSSLDALHEVQLAGAMVGSLHPAFPFSSVDSSVKGLMGVTFAIEYSHSQLRDWLLEIIHALSGQVIEVPAGKKAQYHAALAIASNYMVTLYAIAQDLLSDLSDDDIAIQRAINTLMTGTMHNLIEQGVPDALTGPLVRGDVGTIERHLMALSENPLLYETYRNLARLSYPMLQARGTDIDTIEKLFRQDNRHATDNS